MTAESVYVAIAGTGMVVCTNRTAMGEFGSLLLHYRRRLGLTQRHLADLSAVSVRTIRYLESGVHGIRPRIETIQLLADGLGLGDMDRLALELAVERQTDPAAAARAGEPVLGTSLPTRTNPLIGREAELGVLHDLVLRVRQRLVAIVGLSGVGKTRLALELAWMLRGHGLPVAWIGWPRDSNCNVDERWQRHIHDQHEYLARLSRADDLLLVLDGVDADMAVSIDSIVNLLAVNESLRIVLTTRNPRWIPRGSTFPLSPLALPAGPANRAVVDLERFGALKLLDMCIRKVSQSFRLDQAVEVVTELCRRFDGLPAALELAGHTCLMYSPAELLTAQTRDPLALLSSLAGPFGYPDPVPAWRSCIGDLEPSTLKLLNSLTTLDDPWSMSEAADLAGVTTASLLEELHQLTLGGYVRRDEAGFHILSLVRHILVDPDSLAGWP